MKKILNKKDSIYFDKKENRGTDCFCSDQRCKAD